MTQAPIFDEVHADLAELFRRLASEDAAERRVAAMVLSETPEPGVDRLLIGALLKLAAGQGRLVGPPRANGTMHAADAAASPHFRHRRGTVRHDAGHDHVGRPSGHRGAGGRVVLSWIRSNLPRRISGAGSITTRAFVQQRSTARMATSSTRAKMTGCWTSARRAAARASGRTTPTIRRFRSARNMKSWFRDSGRGAGGKRPSASSDAIIPAEPSFRSLCVERRTSWIDSMKPIGPYNVEFNPTDLILRSGGVRASGRVGAGGPPCQRPAL
jgi:hypothetical protein